MRWITILLAGIFTILPTVGIYAHCKGEKHEDSHAHTVSAAPYFSVFVEGADLSSYDSEAFKLRGIMCQSCIKNVEKALRKVDGVVAIRYHWEEKKLEVWGKDVNREKIKEAVESAGYSVES